MEYIGKNNYKVCLICVYNDLKFIINIKGFF